MQRTTGVAIDSIRNHPQTADGADGNRGGFRFSFGSAFMMGLIEPPASMPGWHALAEPPAVLRALDAIFESDDYRCTGLAGVRRRPPLTAAPASSALFSFSLSPLTRIYGTEFRTEFSTEFSTRI